MRRSLRTSRVVSPEQARPQARPATRSWTALLAATTLGVAGASMVRADIQSNALLDETRTYRLVVQSYDTPASDRPVASVQREVTAEELRAGVRVGLLEFRQGRWDADARTKRAGAPVVLAWIEEGKADLELDGLRARPRPGSLQGASTRATGDASAQLTVRRA